MQWCWLMTSLYILLCRIWPVWTPKWWILTDLPPSAASMVYTWHSVGLEVQVSDALWAVCFTEGDNEWAVARRPPSFAPHYSGDCVWFVVSVQLGSLQSGPKSVSAPKISDTSSCLSALLVAPEVSPRKRFVVFCHCCQERKKDLSTCLCLKKIYTKTATLFWKCWWW